MKKLAELVWLTSSANQHTEYWPCCPASSQAAPLAVSNGTLCEDGSLYLLCVKCWVWTSASRWSMRATIYNRNASELPTIAATFPVPSLCAEYRLTLMAATLTAWDALASLMTMHTPAQYPHSFPACCCHSKLCLSDTSAAMASSFRYTARPDLIQCNTVSRVVQ